MSALQEEFAQSAAKLIQKAAELGYTVTLGGDGTTNSGAAVGSSVSLPESGYGNAVFLIGTPPSTC
jgi:hypothetical protein